MVHKGLITGPSEEAHLKPLEEVLTRMEQAGLHLKKSKCVFVADLVTSLGHRIGPHPVPKKFKAVQLAPNHAICLRTEVIFGTPYILWQVSAQPGNYPCVDLSRFE